MEKGRRTPRCESGVDRREPSGGDGEKKKYGSLARRDEWEMNEKNNRATEWNDRW